MKTKTIIILLLGLAVGMPVLPMRAAEEEHEGAKVAIPDTLPATWTAVKNHEVELGKAINDKKLDSVHEIAFAIRDLVTALPVKSKLDDENMAKLKANAKFVASLAGRLDESGDAKDQAGTEANFGKLQGVLKSIEALYPAEQLKDPMNGMKM